MKSDLKKENSQIDTPEYALQISDEELDYFRQIAEDRYAAKEIFFPDGHSSGGRDDYLDKS